ncbi:FAD/NAD(P)-binding protein [Pseudoclavibacter chungangensis]|uniref:FAD/NAD(P)-binding protein n=1 Tax=Pseudoclavibacter chungangensis TaxID=587635 RepID=A0A7J5BSQ1_9MICO|nr:FAD/NAD(P)-binding protein [Pseudoclavibacter chungangensis]KAB1657334.1 FAD/NAD(P)-binding protein [Pseudoclavibacter chungangensis]NYJ66210.1 putative NAD(P)/FAD-binding protein YdhS [Pseudoclavibacter chungangensis]
MSDCAIRLVDRDPARGARCVAVVGGGPRGVGWIERFAASSPELGTGPVVIHLIDPFPAGAGRIWRDDQSALLKMNSLAADVTMFTDETSTIDGPIAPGPSLAEWAADVRDGRITDVYIDPATEPALAAELAGLGPGSFATRRLQAQYLDWFARRAIAKLPAGSRVRHHVATATSVTDQDNGTQRIEMSTGEVITVDLVVYALGHSGRTPTERERSLESFARDTGASYVPPSYTADADFGELQPGEPVIVRGMGLAAIDLMVLLYEGRGGRFDEQADGTLRYTPSGQEPHLWFGSRRGVPYHAKVTVPMLAGPVTPRYFSREIASTLVADRPRLDFRVHVLPLVHKELLHGYYHELFAAHPERVRGTWASFVERLDVVDARSVEAAELIAEFVPDERDRFEIDRAHHPLAGRTFDDVESLQDALRAYIADDLDRRERPKHSESAALFTSLLHAYFAVAEIADAPNWTARSVAQDLRGSWGLYFSSIASGPPGHRLRELHALSAAGVLGFLGGGVDVTTDRETGEFVARGANLAAPVRARALVDAWLPDLDAEHSDDPALRDLVVSGAGRLHVHDDGAERAATGRIEVRPEDSRVVRADGSPHARRFAIGPSTSAPFVGAFSRPRTNALSFRENDVVARAVLDELAVLRGLAGPSAPDPAREPVSGFDGVVVLT